MALVKFELKEEHLKLMKHLRWTLIESHHIISKPDEMMDLGDSPFGGDDLVEDMYNIIYGKPENFNPIDDEGLEISDEIREELIRLFTQLPTAIDVVLYTQSFKPGHYKSKWYDRNWTSYTPKQIEA